MTRIIIFVPDFGLSGGYSTLYSLSDYLLKSGYNSILMKPIIPIVQRPIYRGRIKYIIDIIRFIFKSIFVVRDSPQKKQTFHFYHKNDYWDADLYIVTTWSTAYTFRKNSKILSKTLYFVQGYELWDGNAANVKATYDLDIKILTVSHYMQHILKSVHKKETINVGNGIDLSEWENVERMDTSDRVYDIITHCSLLEQKGTLISFAVLRELRNLNPKLKVCVFGFKKYYAADDINMEFYEKPSRHELLTLFGKSKYFLNMSIDESFALMPLEAMYSGCVVLSTPVGAVPEYLIDRYNGIILPINDIGKSVEIINDTMKTDSKILNNLVLNGIAEAAKWRIERTFENIKKEIVKKINK